MKSIHYLNSLFFLGIIVLIGCAPEAAEEETAMENSSIFEINVTETVTEEIEEEEGACTPRWRCISRSIKAYQLENCSFAQRVTCPLGCVNDSCRAGSTCISGFRCVNERMVGYQTEGCTFINKRECEWRCENNKCIAKPENMTLEEPAAPASEPPVTPKSTLTVKRGESLKVSLGEQEYVVKIYNLQSDQVIMEVDNRRSDWILEGGGHIYPQGVKLIVVGLYLQQYSGGKQEVEFTLEETAPAVPE